MKKLTILLTIAAMFIAGCHNKPAKEGDFTVDDVRIPQTANGLSQKEMEKMPVLTFEKTTYNELPYKFEAGTPDYIGSIALANALDYVQGIGMDSIAGYEKELCKYAIDRLNEIPGMRIIGNATHRSAVISFMVGNIHPSDMGTLLDRLGIAVRTGHHCAEPLMDRFGIPGTVRASFSFYNTRQEIDVLVAGIERVKQMF